MKQIHHILFIALAILLFVGNNSCERQEIENKAKGTFEIGLTTENYESILKSASNDTIERNDLHLLISVVNASGVMVFDDEIIPLYNFGSGYVSNKVELEAGSYELTKFFVISGNEVLYASPLEGSERSYLVEKPLPLSFRIIAEEVTRINPEVLPVGDFSPSDFGYAAFGFQIVNPLRFYAIAIYDNPLLMAPTQLINAVLHVTASNGWQYEFRMKPELNKFIVPFSESYKFLVKTENGRMEYNFTARELKSSNESNPLVFKFTANSTSPLILKPGSEIGIDATITNLNPDSNFGDYPFFEASFISEPVLTVMRTKQSLLAFNMNEIPKSARIDSMFLILSFVMPQWDNTRIWNPNVSGQLVLEKIAEPWNEYEVTWNNQPKTTDSEQHKFTFYPDLSTNRYIFYVSPLLNSDDGIPSYGLMLKIPEPENWQGIRFASSDHPDARLHPELHVYYTLPE